MFRAFQEEIPNHSIIRMKLIYHVYEELDEEKDAVLSYLIYPIEVDGSGTLADFETMDKVRKRIEICRVADSIDLHSNTHTLYYDDTWKDAVGIWDKVRRNLNLFDANEDRITVNYRISSMEYEVIIPGSEYFPYTTIVLVSLKDIGLLKILGFNDLSIVTDYLKRLQFNGDSGSISMTVSFVRMAEDLLATEVDTDEMVNQVKEVLAMTPDILSEDMKSLFPDKTEE